MVKVIDNSNLDIVEVNPRVINIGTETGGELRKIM